MHRAEERFLLIKSYSVLSTEPDFGLPALLQALLFASAEAGQAPCLLSLTNAKGSQTRLDFPLYLRTSQERSRRSVAVVYSLMQIKYLHLTGVCVVANRN